MIKIERNAVDKCWSRAKFASLLLVTFIACARNSDEPRKQTPSAEPATNEIAKAAPSSDSTQTDSKRLPPLGNGEWLERLATADGNVAYVSPPLGAREPRPIIVAVHGAGDRPEWACGGWRLACSAFAFVVCPRGTTTGGERYAWASAEQLRAAIEPALRATRQRFVKYVADTPLIYAGFSQGATLARAALRNQAHDYRAVILAEGGYELQVSREFAKELRGNGLERMLLVCGGPGCFAHARRAQPLLERAGLSVFVTGDPRSGHNLNAPMQAALHETWPDFVRGLPGWSTFEPALK